MRESNPDPQTVRPTLYCSNYYMHQQILDHSVNILNWYLFSNMLFQISMLTNKNKNSTVLSDFWPV